MGINRIHTKDEVVTIKCENVIKNGEVCDGALVFSLSELKEMAIVKCPKCGHEKFLSK